jgi:hypothetical protein
VSNITPTTQRQPPNPSGDWPEMPEVRLLLSLRSNETQMRRRMMLCDELSSALESLVRAARALTLSGLGAGDEDVRQCIQRAPASAHTICAMIRDFGEAINRLVELVGFDGPGGDEGAGAADSPVAPSVRRTLVQAMDEHTRLRSWDQVKWIGLSVNAERRVAFRWSVAMECVQKNAHRAYPALRPVVLLARRIGDEAMALLDPLSGALAAERAAAYAGVKKLRTRIINIREIVNQKCDLLEGEMRSVQTAIVRSQKQAIALAKHLQGVDPTQG